MTILSLVLLFSAPASGAMAWEDQEAYRSAVSALAQFDFGSISSRDAANWAVIRILPDKSSGAGAWQGRGFEVSPTGQLIPAKGKRPEGVINKGEWELIARLVPVPHATRKGKYDWLDPHYDMNAQRVPYHPFSSGGCTVLTEQFPDKKGADQFGRTVVLPADMVKWIPAAYAFRQKNAKIFGEKIEEQALVELLHDKNPMIAIMAGQRLARGHRLSSAATDAMLDGPADSRRALAFYLRLTPPGSKPKPGARLHREEPPKGESWVTPGMKAAIDKADGAMLRCYVFAIVESWESCWPAFYKDSYALSLRLCRQRAGALKLDRELREELDSLTQGWQ